jgi:succinyl-CoA synthetase beta subunit
MNIHEYQAKELLKSYGVRIQEGIVADSPENCIESRKKTQCRNRNFLVCIKAQIHAGGRGKGKVKKQALMEWFWPKILTKCLRKQKTSLVALW